MTKLEKPVSRETDAKYNDRPIIATLEPKGLRLRLKGLRSHAAYFLRYEDLFIQGARSAAE